MNKTLIGVLVCLCATSSAANLINLTKPEIESTPTAMLNADLKAIESKMQSPLTTNKDLSQYTNTMEQIKVELYNRQNQYINNNYDKAVKSINAYLKKNTYYKTKNKIYTLTEFIDLTTTGQLNPNNVFNTVLYINKGNHFAVSQVIETNHHTVAVMDNNLFYNQQILLISGTTGQWFVNNMKLKNVQPRFMVFKGYQAVKTVYGEGKKLPLFQLLSLPGAPDLPVKMLGAV